MSIFKEKMDLSVIIVSWNVKDLLRENLAKIYQNTQDINFEVFVVDNDSKDDSANMVKSEFSQVNLIANSFNGGFAKANNQAIKFARGRYILLFNPDMRVKGNSFKDMVNWMDKHKQAGVASCSLVDVDGNTVPHVRRDPGVLDQAAIILKIPHIMPKVLDKYMMPNFDYTKEAIVDSIRGSFFMIRREVIDKIGGLDERYFIWFEEVDYCKMVRKAGWNVMYTPEVECVDYIGKSFNQVMGYKKQQMFTDSMQKYFKKWHPGIRSTIISFLRPIGLFISFVYDNLKKLK